MNETIEQIIDLEWAMFQETNNIGGRADCQDDFETFYIMRRAQYENWSPEMVAFYYDFACRCREEGRNLVTEKYGRMMEFTDLHYYSKHVEPYIPAVPRQNYTIINEIMAVLIPWEEDFARSYPKMAGAGRPITSDGDATGFTSMETYARGELLTYPATLLQMYLDYVHTLQTQGKSLSVMIQDTLVKLYGYGSIAEAEERL